MIQRLKMSTVNPKRCKIAKNKVVIVPIIFDKTKTNVLKQAEKIKDELEKISGVQEVNIFGGDEKEFEIAYDPQKLTYYNITVGQANQVVASLNHIFPGGNFEGEKFNYPVSVDGRFFNAEKLGNIPLTHIQNGNILYLKDVAKVSEKSIKKTIYSRLSINGQEPQSAVTVSLVKKTGGSIVDIVDEAKKVELYRNASLFVFPSLYEGFGLPVLEAMSAGVPVITSNRSSLPEVCGDAVYYVNPNNVLELAEAMKLVLTDEKLRQNMIQKGLEQAKKFSWEDSAKVLLSLF